MSTTNIVEASDIEVTFGTGRAVVRALRGVSVTLRPGEAVALRGPSGCGKSTLMRAIGLRLWLTAGSLAIGGSPAPTARSSRARLRNSFFGYVEQEFGLIGRLSAQANVAVPLEYARPRPGAAQRRECTTRALTQVGLHAHLGDRVSELSGGERQRVAIARALVNEPTVVLADEPTGALDSATAGDILTVLLGVRDRGATLLIATHDERVAAACDRTIDLLDGRIQATSG
ncbi:MAG TPA: ABC transporter ATP-binding protein [Dermatophilaceae bacterium]|jgi:putative ABC transport system ATP-binding protein|nr:ABC transporter ATP-binding protein [Dermatophilaceae bacterium]HMT88314.1 ABC transporter ATP-binding protein [Dermatophilaceae bacterium]